MADQINDGGEILFLYTGGEQEIPSNVTRVLIDKSVKIVPADAFSRHKYLMEVEGQDGIATTIIERRAFYFCISLRRVKIPGVRFIGQEAFFGCLNLSDMEFGHKLETIGQSAFCFCKSLKNINMPSLRRIDVCAFQDCDGLLGAEFGVELETIDEAAFYECTSLRRIVIPLKDAVMEPRNRVLDSCRGLTTVDLVGGTHRTISCLFMESWRNEMLERVNRINAILPYIPVMVKTTAIQVWIQSVTNRMEHYKSEHQILLKEAMTLLELALWKANLDKNNANDGVSYQDGVRITRGRIKRARKEKCITSGASIIIKNVLPFLQLPPEL
jgi:hypothetical protein